MQLRTLCLLILSLIILSCNVDKDQSKPYLPPPVHDIEIYQGHEEGTGKGDLKRQWQKEMHRASPGTDWAQMDRDYVWKRYQRKLQSAQKVDETFAGGLLTAEWLERGSLNQAGNLAKVDYDKVQDAIYGISGGGTIWKSNVAGTSWTPLNEDLQFHSKILDHAYFNGNLRLYASIEKQLHYSDDDGITWTRSAGLDPGNTWGFPAQLESKDNGEVYFLVFTWDSSINDSSMWLYYSSNGGQNFTKLQAFQHNAHFWDARLYTKMWSTKRSNTLYINHLGKEMYTAQSGVVTQLTANSGLPTLQALDLEGALVRTSTTLYALIGNSNLYTSIDQGLSWNMVSTLNTNTWEIGIAVNEYDPNQLWYGEVELYRSGNGGASWTRQNTWGSYYGNQDRVHADIMDVEFFQKTDGTIFSLIGNHGGLHISYDHSTTQNIGKSGLNISQYYDVITHPNDPEFIFGGTQDQGFHRTDNGDGFHVASFEQVISGDYGHLATSDNGNAIWTVYPGTDVAYYSNSKTGNSNDWYTVAGSNLSVNGWIGCTAETTAPADNSILVAGGNINGGNGSHLITLTANNNIISATQNSFDFRANAGNSTISAIENAILDPNKIFVATANGSFFYSNNNGSSWTKTSGFSGPGEFWLYGATVLSSNQDANRVYFGGSGYSNPAVYVSNDGGVTFTAMDNGLPNTLIYELASDPTETFLYAATEVGPFVYVVAQDQWYPISGVGAPVQQYYSVEYVNATNTVRFGTYGRGIWDFVIDGACLANYVIQTPITNNITEEATLSIKSSSTLIGNINVIFDAGECVELQPGFTVPAGANFETKLDGCN